MNIIAWVGDEASGIDHARNIASVAKLGSDFIPMHYAALPPILTELETLIILDRNRILTDSVRRDWRLFHIMPKNTVYVTLSETEEPEFPSNDQFISIEIGSFSVVPVANALVTALHELKEGKLKKM